MMLSQSTSATLMRGNLSVYALRIFVQIVVRANESLEGTLHKQFIHEQADWHRVSRRFDVPIRDIIADSSHNYKVVQDAALELQRQVIQYWDSTSRTWLSSPMIYAVSVQEGSGVLSFAASEWVVKLILDFSQGFNRYELDHVMSLTSAYSVRLYMLMCGCRRQLSLSIEYLRGLLSLQPGQYKQTGDMLKRCVYSAAKDLATRKYNGFDVEVVKRGGKITGVVLHPVKREELSATQVVAALPGLSAIDPALKQYLISQCGFSSRELAANKVALVNLVKVPGWQDHLLSVVERARAKRASKGYIINGIKSVYSAAITQGIIQAS